MSESEQDQSPTPRFSKAMLGRISAVAFFVVLGTFAVIHSMKGTQLNAVKATVNLPANATQGDSNTPEDVDQEEPKNATAGLIGAGHTPLADSKPETQAKPVGFKPTNFSASSDNAMPTLPSNKPPGSGGAFAAQPPTRSFSSKQSFTQPDKGQSSSRAPVANARPAKKPADRYALLPTGVPVIGSKNGFGQRPDPAATQQSKSSTNSFGNFSPDEAASAVSKLAAGATAKLQADVGNGANSLLQKANGSVDETTKAATENLNQKFGGGFGPGIPPAGGSFGGTTNPAQRSLGSPPADPDPQAKTKSLFGERPTALSQIPTNKSPTTAGNQNQQNGGPNGRPDNRPIANRIGNDNQSGGLKTAGPFGNPSANNANANAASTNDRPFGAKPPGLQSNGNRLAPDARHMRATTQKIDNPNIIDPLAQRAKIQAQTVSATPFANRPNSQFGGPSADGVDTQPSRQLSPANQPRNMQTNSRMPNNAGLGSNLSPSKNLYLASTGSTLTRNVPGDRKLDGMQAPALTIEKLSPREIQLNQTAGFEIVVKNVGRATAENVTVIDEIPAGTEFQESTPRPEARGQGQSIQWNLEQLRPGQEKRIKLMLKPVQPGEMGSVAHVTFSTQASSRTLVTKPILKIVHQTNATHLIGDNVVLDVVVSNEGDGAAKNVIIQQDVPLQLEFPEGLPGGSRAIEYEIGTLMPGQTRRVRLALKAADVGKLQNVMHASADGGLSAKHEVPIEVVAPKLVAKSDGATRGFLKRNVTHQFSVTNQGTANATNVEFVAKLPRGLKYIQSNNQGRYDANTHAVYWSLAELSRGVEANVELKAVPIDVGNQPIKFESSADLNIRSRVEHALSVEHLVDVFFEFDDVIDPIEIGGDTSYRLRIVNQGTKAATNVQLQVDFLPGLLPTSVEGSLRHQIRQQQISFEPINSMSPGDELTIVINAKGQTVGDHPVIVKMQTDGRSAPVSKQESTRVYSDR